jgi:GntR family transcriptional regulator
VAYETDQPKYRQLADTLRAAIEQGRYGPGDALPSEPQLSREHGMSRPTVVRAIDLLRRDGLVESHQGRGTFVVGERAPTATEELRRLEAWLAKRYPDRMAEGASPVDVVIALLDAGR